MLCFELTVKSRIEVDKAIIFDKLTAIMVVIAGMVGSLICIYAVGYMKTYHIHHTEYEDRKGFFFAVLFLFISAMLGIVLSDQVYLDVFLLGAYDLLFLSAYRVHKD